MADWRFVGMSKRHCREVRAVELRSYSCKDHELHEPSRTVEFREQHPGRLEHHARLNPGTSPGAMINRMTREELDELIESLEQTPVEVALLLDQISPNEQRIKNADEFSALENICHLRDIEVEGYTKRILRILNEDMPSLSDIDGGRLAMERDYNNQDASVALEVFTTARKRNIEQLRRVIPEQTAREGNLEGVGVISLAKLLEMMLEHDQGHVIELSVIQRRSQLKRDASSI